MALKKPVIGAPCNGCGLCCRITVCSTGSFAMGLVENFGERAPGPCPALTKLNDGRQVCGLVARPTDWLPHNPNGVTTIRDAVKILIGAGAGCDERGEDPERDEDDAGDKIIAIQRDYLARHGEAAIQRAARIVFDRSRS